MSTETQIELHGRPVESIDVTPETLPATATGLPFADATDLKAQLARYTETRKVFMEWIGTSLTPGVDYMLIHRKVGPRGQKLDCPDGRVRDKPSCPRCGGKATLCKPGAEKIAGLLQLTPRFRRDQETLEMLGKDSVVAYVCNLVNGRDVVVAEGRGARTVTQDYDDVNKTVKMCQKSAQIDATLRLAGLSEVFTQDLEDMPLQDREERDDFGTPPRKTAPPASEAAPTDCLSENKVKAVRSKIHAQLKACGRDDAATMALVEQRLDELAAHDGRSKWQHASWRDFPSVLDAVESVVATLPPREHARRVRR